MNSLRFTPRIRQGDNGGSLPPPLPLMVADLPLTDIAAVVRRFPSPRVIAAEHRLDSTTDSQSAPECNRLAKRVESAASFDAHFVEVRDDELLAHAVDAAA